MFPSFIFYLALSVTLTYCDERGPRVRRIVGGKPADLPPEDDPLVFTRFNGKAARIQGARDQPHYVFRGIRYAEPPTKRDRFLRPKEYLMSGYINATSFPPPCVQPDVQNDKIIGDEDCLFLNLFTPELPTGTEGLPVVVWIHGGGFRIGSASQYGVRHLVAQRIIVVTIQYRLGSLGFLTTGSQELPGNAALWDMALAVQWVRNYIGFFGGNPYRIVVMGQGTGGNSALLVTLSNIAKGISGVIAMSGTAVSNWAVDNTPTNTAAEIAQANGCPDTSITVMIRCLQKVSAENIIKGDNEINFMKQRDQGVVMGLSGRSASSPRTEGVHDGRSLPPIIQREPIEDITAKRNPKVPLLVGVTKDETKRAVQVKYKDELLNKLKTVPDYLDKVLVKSLQNTVQFKDLIKGNVEQSLNSVLGGFGNFDSLQFGNYLKSATNDLKESLSKIADATADALFNLPAFLTADLWSKSGTPAFLYSFEHDGKARKGYSFLRGIPLVGDKPPQDNLNESIVAHGDDLAYLFDANDIYGQPLEDIEILTEEDIEVRNVYTKMIADFAKEGKVSVENKFVSPFSTTDNNFIQIKPNPKVQNGFKYCEMALWFGLADRLKSQTCGFLKQVDLTKLPIPLDVANNPIGNGQKNIDKSINKLTSNLNKGNIFSPNIVPGMPTVSRNQNMPKANPASLGGLFNL